MFKKSLFSSVAFGAVGLAGIVYMYRKLISRSANQNPYVSNLGTITNEPLTRIQGRSDTALNGIEETLDTSSNEPAELPAITVEKVN